MAHLVWVNDLPIEYFTVLQVFSFAICAYFASRIANSDVRPAASGFVRSAVSDVV